MERTFQAQKRKLQTSSGKVWKGFTEDIISELGIEKCIGHKSGKRYTVRSKKSQYFKTNGRLGNKKQE